MTSHIIFLQCSEVNCQFQDRSPCHNCLEKKHITNYSTNAYYHKILNFYVHKVQSNFFPQHNGHRFKAFGNYKMGEFFVLYSPQDLSYREIIIKKGLKISRKVWEPFVFYKIQKFQQISVCILPDQTGKK